MGWGVGVWVARVRFGEGKAGWNQEFTARLQVVQVQNEASLGCRHARCRRGGDAVGCADTVGRDNVNRSVNSQRIQGICDGCDAWVLVLWQRPAIRETWRRRLGHYLVSAGVRSDYCNDGHAAWVVAG